MDLYKNLFFGWYGQSRCWFPAHKEFEKIHIYESCVSRIFYTPLLPFDSLILLNSPFVIWFVEFALNFKCSSLLVSIAGKHWKDILGSSSILWHPTKKEIANQFLILLMNPMTKLYFQLIANPTKNEIANQFLILLMNLMTREINCIKKYLM